MEITVLNGSPKGDVSVTMQYVHFIGKKFPQHKLNILNISQKIHKLEKDEKAFQEIIDRVKSSDGILWASPVYVCLVPSQYVRFIELVTKRQAESAFKNKYAAVLTTSYNFFDHTAHRYMNAVCDDLNMKYIDFFSADANDLLNRQGRDRLILFAECFFEAIEKNIGTSKRYQPLTYGKFNYAPGDVVKKTEVGDKKILILTDSLDPDTNLYLMIERFKHSFSREPQVVNIHDIDIKGGCLGCIQCWYDYQCVYKDGFVDFYNTKVKAADIIIFAGTVKGRYLSSRWKQFNDRIFFNHHRPSLIGKQMGGIISGPVGQTSVLLEIFEAVAEFSQANPVDYLSDECKDSKELDDLLQGFAERLIFFAEKKYIRPATFMGVGGMKIFRDETWGRWRFIFPGDHMYYKKHGIYDFPQKDYRTRLFNLLMTALTKIPAFRKEFSKRMKTGMIMAHKKIVETR